MPIIVEETLEKCKVSLLTKKPYVWPNQRMMIYDYLNLDDIVFNVSYICKQDRNKLLEESRDSNREFKLTIDYY